MPLPIPIWAVFALTLAAVLLSIELGYRYGMRSARGAEKEAPVGTMVGATLVLLAFMLTFTFSMAEGSFHARQVAIREQASAIRAAYLRAALIPEPQRSEVRRILLAYVDERLRWAGAADYDVGQTSRPLLDQLWAQAAEVGAASPNSHTVALFIQSVNEVIKLHEERDVLRGQIRIPTAFWVVLYAMAILAFAVIGYHGGVTGTIRSPVLLAVAITFSLVIMLIVDVNQPGRGWVQVSQDPLIGLRASLTQSKP